MGPTTARTGGAACTPATSSAPSGGAPTFDQSHPGPDETSPAGRSTQEGRWSPRNKYRHGVTPRGAPSSVGRARLWKLESWITGALGVFVAQVLMRAIYRMIRKDKAPSAVFDPNSSRFSWADAGVWALAGGVGL